MNEPSSWRALKGPDPTREGVVLAVNFLITGRPDAGFDDLVPQMSAGYQVWETVPPPAGTEAGMTGSDYVARWARDVHASGLAVRGILGNCAGSAYAPALAARIADWQDTQPEMVLFDPELPSPLTLYWQFHNVIAASAGLLQPNEVASAQQAGQKAMEQHKDLGSLAAALIELFRETGGIAFDRLGLDATRKNALIQLFSSYLSYLVAASEVIVDDGWLKAAAISSSTPHSGLNRVPEAERSEWVGRELRFEVEHENLLRSADVARVVSELLA